jgi:hypothetical protein
MPVSSGRRSTISLCFDMLEERSLLSHFSMPAFPDWGFQSEHASGPPPAFAGTSNRQPGPFGDGPGGSPQGPSPTASESMSQAVLAIVSDSASDSTPLSSPLVQPVFQRTQPSDQGQGEQPDDVGVAPAIAASSAPSVAPALSPTVPGPLETTSGAISVGISGLARLVPVTVGLIVPDLLLGRAWASQPTPSYRELETARPPGASGDPDMPIETGRRSPLRLPAPLGADLITEFTGLRQTPIGDSLKRVFGSLSTSDEPVASQTHHAPYLLPIALAAAAFEVARRWRRGSSRTSIRSRRVHNSLLIELPRTSR